MPLACSASMRALSSRALVSSMSTEAYMPSGEKKLAVK